MILLYKLINKFRHINIKTKEIIRIIVKMIVIKTNKVIKQV